MIEVPRQAAAVDTFAGFHSYNFELTGEVVLDNQLFETFRYKFGFPERESPTPPFRWRSSATFGPATTRW